MNCLDCDELLKRLAGIQEEIRSYSPYKLNNWKSVDDAADYTCKWNHTTDSFLQDKSPYLSDEDKIMHAINEWARNTFANKDCPSPHNSVEKTNHKPKTEIKESEILRLLINE